MQTRENNNDNDVHQHQLIQRKENSLQGKNIPTMQRKGLGFMTGGPLQFSWGNEPSQLKKGEEEELSQMKPIQKKSSGGEKMPEHINSKMSNAFGHNFSNVNIHNNSSSAKDVGALAYAQGNDVHFAPGQMKLDTQKGQELLGHELTHVVQQREGRVQPTTQAKGMAVNDDKGLEKEADDMGKKAAEGKSVQMKNTSSIMQRKDLGFMTGTSLQFSLGNELTQLKIREEELKQMKPIQKQNDLGLVKRDRTRPEREREQTDPTIGGYGEKYTTWAQAFAAETYLKTILIPAETAMFGAEVGALWLSYLCREKGDSLAHRKYFEGRSGIAYAFKHCNHIKDRQNRLLDIVANNLSLAPNLPANKWASVPIYKFIGSSDLNHPINFNNPYDTPGNIAGGVSGCDGGPDFRKVSGNVQLYRMTEGSGHTTKIVIRPDFDYFVQDGIDFLPGGAGSGLEQAFTIPLSRLEASNWAYDVPFQVFFKGPKMQREVKGKSGYPMKIADSQRIERQRTPRKENESYRNQPRMRTTENSRRRDF